MARLEGGRDGNVLDLGPACGENIRFFASRAARLYVCDLFRRLALDPGRSASGLWRHLNYPEEAFEAILLWTLPDHLEDGDLARLARLCHTLLRGGGTVMLVSLGTETPRAPANCFVVGPDYRVQLRPQSHLQLPVHHRHNRDLIAMAAPLVLDKSFIYRNGLREFLFRKP